MRRALALLAVACAACTDVNTCQTGPATVGDACIPRTIAPNLPVKIELRELCGNECDSLPGCTAILRNGEVVLEVEQEVCTASSGTCNAGCQQRAFPCTLPPLTPGDWPLAVPGGPPRLLHVQAEGAASCLFPDAGVQ